MPTEPNITPMTVSEFNSRMVDLTQSMGTNSKTTEQRAMMLLKEFAHSHGCGVGLDMLDNAMTSLRFEEKHSAILSPDPNMPTRHVSLR
jgi:kynureninase